MTQTTVKTQSALKPQMEFMAAGYFKLHDFGRDGMQVKVIFALPPIPDSVYCVNVNAHSICDTAARIGAIDLFWQTDAFPVEIEGRRMSFVDFWDDLGGVEKEEILQGTICDDAKDAVSNWPKLAEQLTIAQFSALPYLMKLAHYYLRSKQAPGRNKTWFCNLLEYVRSEKASMDLSADPATRRFGDVMRQAYAAKKGGGQAYDTRCAAGRLLWY